MIVTGGRFTRYTVSVYNVEGWQEDLPPLNTDRRSHACSSYLSGERRVRYYEGEINKPCDEVSEAAQLIKRVKAYKSL